jgi:catechol 2,3-dioxygenase-like lactoylglutathione lyase family enzyme
MKFEFPAAVPEIPVTDMDQALDYYARTLGFGVDWGGAGGGIAAFQRASAGCSSRTVTFASIIAMLRQR